MCRVVCIDTKAPYVPESGEEGAEVWEILDLKDRQLTIEECLDARREEGPHLFVVCPDCGWTATVGVDPDLSDEELDDVVFQMELEHDQRHQDCLGRIDVYR